MIQGFSGGLLNRELIYNLDLPSFQRDFASLKTLDHGTGPAITFTRASGGTYFDANGVLQTASNDAPRFDHDPVTGASRGLLIEEARTNLLQRSAEFDNAYWSKFDSSITANAAAAPDGTTSADLLVEDSDNAVHYVYREITHAGANSAATISIFAKAKERTRIELALRGKEGASTVSGGRAVFNLSDGTVGSFTAINSGTGSVSITDVGDGWYRCTLTATPVGITATVSEVFYSLHDGTGITYTGDGTSGIYIWGAQVEAGAFPTSYIPTTTATATRSADSAVVTPISSFYNQSEGTMFGEASRYAAGDVLTTIVLQFDDNNGSDNRTFVAVGTPGISTNTAGGTLAGNVASGSQNVAIFATAAQVSSAALAYKTDDFAAVLDGGTVQTDTNATLPATRTHARIGDNSGGARYNGHIRKIAYWPKRLTNTLLEQLTT